MVEQKAQLCVVCAWRADCKKKFRISKEPGLHCPDFTRDITLKAPEDKKTDGETEKDK